MRDSYKVKKQALFGWEEEKASPDYVGMSESPPDVADSLAEGAP